MHFAASWAANGLASLRSSVLIDDLERGIHPRAIADLIAQIRRFLDVSPDLQIVATSHSPYLVELLDPAEVRLMLADRAGAWWAWLDDHPEFERWRGFMRPGEIWSMIGEDWIGAQGKRSPATCSSVVPLFDRC